MAIKLILSDGDGTLWEYDNEPFKSSWDALIRAFPENLKKKWLTLRDTYIDKGRKDNQAYFEGFTKQLAILKGVSLKDVEQHLFPIPYSLGVREFFASVNGRYQRGIVSSGISLVVDRAADELEIDFSVSNIIYTDNDGYFTGKGELVLNLKGKGDLVRKIARERNILLEEVCFIGDNENDIPALGIVGCPVVFRAKTSATEKSAKYTINDFRELEVILDENES